MVKRVRPRWPFSGVSAVFMMVANFAAALYVAGAGVFKEGALVAVGLWAAGAGIAGFVLVCRLPAFGGELVDLRLLGISLCTLVELVALLCFFAGSLSAISGQVI